MFAKLQKFGGAMMVPVMLMPFAGILIGISSIFINPDIIGNIAETNIAWIAFWEILNQAGNAIFEQLPLLFAISLPLGLVKRNPGRAAVESFVIYTIFNYYVGIILTYYGTNVGIDFTQEIGGDSGLTAIAGIKTLDMNVVGAVLIAAIVVWLHNKYSEVKLPELLNVFQGSALVIIIGTFVMIPTAIISSIVWPQVQGFIYNLQEFLVSTGSFGVFLFSFLERLLIPTGLHHFLWVPFDLGPAVVPDGNWTHWMNNISTYANATEPLINLFPSGGFALYGNAAVFGLPAAALAMYHTANEDQRKKVAGILIPIALTSMLTGITEPMEFSFLFISFPLYVVHTILGGLLSLVLYQFGVVGYQGAGLIDYITYNWIPMFNNHSQMVINHIIIGIIFSIIYYFVFKFYIEKFDVKTIGREDKLNSVAKDTSINLSEKKAEYDNRSQGSSFDQQAILFLQALGGKENIKSVTNCVTRLRVQVYNDDIVASDDVFTDAGAYGVVRKPKSYQVIVGMNVGNVRDSFDNLL